MTCFQEGCDTKGQETARKWLVEAETRSAEVIFAQPKQVLTCLNFCT